MTHRAYSRKLEMEADEVGLEVRQLMSLKSLTRGPRLHFIPISLLLQFMARAGVRLFFLDSLLSVLKLIHALLP